MNKVYPSATTAIASPAATKPTDVQNGSSRRKNNSDPTTNALITTGTSVEKNKFLEKEIIRQLANVANDPKSMSYGEKDMQLAIMHPKVNPIV